MAIEHGQLVALYCSDVSGAFDRVCASRLVQEPASQRLHPRIRAMLSSWLEPRQSQVLVEGSKSCSQELTNSVYQGTVWGPPLWNVFYADATAAVSKCGYVDIMFADDLNCTKVMSPVKTNGEVFDDAKLCQGELHRWGAANQVRFHASKE